MQYKVKQLSEMVGASVRTLHHYHQIGLLKPESHTPSGYRVYSEQNLERLQQILFFKEIGFNLQEIKEILDSPNFDRRHALHAHKELLLKKRDRLNEMILTVEKTIDSIEGGFKMENEEMFRGFDMKDIEEHQAKYAEEAKQKYGNSEAYRESQSRVAKYSKEDWAVIMEQGDQIYKKIAKIMDKGPADSEVQEAIEAKRNHISKYFYECTLDIFRGLGDLYVNDERFTSNIDKYKVGLAEFLREAMHVYCDNHSH